MLAYMLAFNPRSKVTDIGYCLSLGASVLVGESKFNKKSLDF